MTDYYAPSDRKINAKALELIVQLNDDPTFPELDKVAFWTDSVRLEWVFTQERQEDQAVSTIKGLAPRCEMFHATFGDEKPDHVYLTWYGQIRLDDGSILEVQGQFGSDNPLNGATKRAYEAVVGVGKAGTE